MVQLNFNSQQVFNNAVFKNLKSINNQFLQNQKINPTTQIILKSKDDQELSELQKLTLRNFNQRLLKKAIKNKSLYSFLKYCSSVFITSPQMRRNLKLYENCNQWHTTTKGEKISGHYLSTTCPNCKKYKTHRLPCGSSICFSCSKQLRDRRFHKIKKLLADEEHAYLVVRLPEKLKNLERFNYKNTKNISKELYPLMSKSLKEYFNLPIKENHYASLEVGYYLALHTYSTSTLMWDLHFNILTSLEAYKLKNNFATNQDINQNPNIENKIIKEINKSITKKQIIKFLKKEYLESKEFNHDLAYEFRINPNNKELSEKQIINKLIKQYQKFNIIRFYDRVKIDYIDWEKLRGIINKNIKEKFGEEYTDKRLYIYDNYSKKDGKITRASPEKTAGLLSSYISNIPLYSKNILKITEDKIIIQLKDTLATNQAIKKGNKKTIYHKLELSHLDFFNKYQQHLLYVEYPDPKKSNTQRVSTMRNLRGQGYYSNNSYFSLCYKRPEEEDECFKCDSCNTHLEGQDIALIVFNGVVIHFACSILHIGLRVFYRFYTKTEEQLKLSLMKYEKPPDFLIPTSQPLYLGQKNKKQLIENLRKDRFRNDFNISQEKLLRNYIIQNDKFNVNYKEKEFAGIKLDISLYNKIKNKPSSIKGYSEDYPMPKLMPVEDIDGLNNIINYPIIERMAWIRDMESLKKYWNHKLRSGLTIKELEEKDKRRLRLSIFKEIGKMILEPDKNNYNQYNFLSEDSIKLAITGRC